MSEFSEPQFISTDADEVLTEMIQQYENMAGKTLNPAQPERLMLDLLAYRETLLRISIQEIAKQNLLAYALGDQLDFLAELVGVTRLEAQKAKTVLQFTNNSGVSVTFSERTQVSTASGEVVFETVEELTVQSGKSETVSAEALEVGTSYNYYVPGQINTLVQAMASLEVTNTQASYGGTDDESDEQLKERIRLAPSSFSSAGAREAYRYHALSVSQSILDVTVLSPSDDEALDEAVIPGIVAVYLLTNPPLESSSALLSEVEAYLSGDSIKAVCDTLWVRAAEAVQCSVSCEVDIEEGYLSDDVNSEVMAVLEAYAESLKAEFAKEAIQSEMIALIHDVEGVVSVSLDLKNEAEEEVETISLKRFQFANLAITSVTVL
ncbi:Baseplate J family protein [Chloroherpeton thalassium ATCC 35110]|uniref:Baseplate J family protein n=1 Tax=Chloroherpeton thalassium (strain ATCC 35110 / GB-78) TaxID=517418 RepID=B3QTJ3_CHLT3|nr:baseplate J/gp47 family protein [Chloroherpeton thalassium]ACF12739.1 Baseplate J family protein [Chloroherpeton thalassium ATCC 35110]